MRIVVSLFLVGIYQTKVIIIKVRLLITDIVIHIAYKLSFIFPGVKHTR